MEIPIFYGISGEDPKEWTEQVEKYLLMKGIEEDERVFKIAKTYLLGNALEWFEDEGICITDWNKNEIKWLRLKFRLIERYSNKESNGIQQEENENVEDYIKRFEKELEIISVGSSVQSKSPVDYFVQGLTPILKYKVKRENPMTLDEAIEIAKREEKMGNRFRAFWEKDDDY